jgi:hypothetical protein
MLIRRLQLILLLATLPGAVHAAEVGGTRVRVEGFGSADTARLRNYVTNTERLLQRFCGEVKRPELVVIAASRDKVVQRPRYVCILGTSTDVPHTVTQTLLTRAVIERSEEYKEGPIPDWFAAGLKYLTLNGEADTPGATRFPTCRTLAEDGHVPSLKKLLDLAVDPKYPIVHSVYSEACGLLVKGLHQQDPGILRRYMEAYSPRLDDSEALLKAFMLKTAANEQEFEGWFAKRFAALAAMKGDGELTLSASATALRKLETVTLAAPRGFRGNAIKRVNLEDADSVLGKYVGNGAEVADLTARFIVLQQRIPYSLRSSLDDYSAAFDYLRIGQTRTFKRRMKEARARFEGELERARELEAYLDRLEQTRGERSSPLAPYRALQKASGEPDKLSEYLDKIERGGE